MPNQPTDLDGEAFEGRDAEQIRMMDEMCILLDRDDNAIESASKKYC